MVVSLHKCGLYSWTEWTEALSARIRSAQAAGDPDLGDTYYRHWIGALEDLVAERRLGSADEIARWRNAWLHAARRVPHGKPIEVQSNDFDTDR